MRLVLCLLLALAAVPAWAEWVVLSKDSLGNTYHFDPDATRVNGIFRRGWLIYDMTVPVNGALSKRISYEHDCREQKVRILSETSHSEHMAGGNVLVGIADEGPRTWLDITPGSVSGVLGKAICAK